MGERTVGSRGWALVGIGLALGCGGSGGSGSTDDPTEATSVTASSADTGVDSSATSSMASSGATDPEPDPDGTGTTGATDSGDPPPVCPSEPGGVGDPCSANAECPSLVCTIYTDAPPDLDAVCASPPPDCGLQITGTALDIATRQPVPALDGRIVLPGGPGGMPLVVTLSDGDGRIDAVVEPVPLGPGLLMLQEGPDHTLTATGVRMSTMANETHDLWVVSNDTADAWSAMLSTDPEIPADALPLGAAGGMVGLVRDPAGQPIAGATLESEDQGSSAYVRYLAADGTFDAGATSELGLFVILEPGLAEVFDVTLGDAVVADVVASSTGGVIWALAITLP